MPVIDLTKAISKQTGNSVKWRHACFRLVADDLKCRTLIIKLAKFNCQFVQNQMQKSMRGRADRHRP